MAKKGRKTGPRGPYKTRPGARDVENPDQLGTGGIRIRQHRLARAWTVAKLAEESGLSDGTISGIENGEIGWSRDSLPKLADALGVTIGELFGVDPRPGKSSDFWTIWNGLKAPQRQRVADFARGIKESD
jgi:transcriptional regulator with XRE-family HTH domain